MAKSRWRSRSEEVVAEVLASLPEDASEQTVRNSLRNAYPFGQRENHPYSIWCDVVRKALGGKPKATITATDPVIYRLVGTDDNRVWLQVRCDWCKGGSPGGCMMCCRHCAKMVEVIQDPTFLAIRGGLKNATSEEEVEVARLALLDWLEEHDVEVSR